MAKFFRSTFFKCAALLLCLMVAFGGLLALLNDLLYVSAEERTARAIKKVYGELKEYTVIMEGQEISCGEFGVIDKIYVVAGQDENTFDYLFHTTGKKGFQDGTITYWVKVKSNIGKLSIDNLLIESNKKQSFIGSLTSDWHQTLYVDIDGQSKYLTSKPDNLKENPELSLVPTTGATNSKNASCNAVNCVIYYFNDYVGGQS